MADITNNNSRTLILLRHGQSQWNEENRFTGWTDIDLSDQGQEEVRNAAHLLVKQGFSIDFAVTSFLKRAIRSLWIVLDEMDRMWTPIRQDWRFNERHYGALQGLNKAETADEFGEEQVRVWRRSYKVRPPALEAADPRHPCHDPRYGRLPPSQLPNTESLEDTIARALPCWNELIAPLLSKGQTVLIVAHGNSLRALIKFLDNLADDDIAALEMPTGIPLVYELDEELHPIRHYYLGDA